MKNVTAIIQARRGSKRLSAKVLADICGVPMLMHIVNRVKCSKRVTDIVVATTGEPIDDSIEEFCKSEKIMCFRGSELNVLERYYEAAKVVGSEIVVRLTGDNPLVEPSFIDICTDKLVDENLDYISVSGCPLGCGVEVFTVESLEEAFFSAKEIYQQEHVTPYIYDNPKLFTFSSYTPDAKYIAPDLRLTVDEKQDLELMNLIYKKFYKKGTIIALPEVIEYLRQNIHISEINKNIKQKDYKEYEGNDKG